MQARLWERLKDAENANSKATLMGSSGGELALAGQDEMYAKQAS